MESLEHLISNVVYNKKILKKALENSFSIFSRAFLYSHF